MVVLGIPFSIYRYVPEAAAAARVCMLVTFKSLASEVLHSLHELTRRRQGGSTLRGRESLGPLDAIVHCFSKHGVLLSMWVGV